MAHPQQEEWMEYLYGEVDPQRQEQMSVHLQTCADCRQQVSAWRSAMKGLDSWSWSNGGTGRRRLFLGPVRWAAAVLLLLTAGIVFGRFTATQPDVKQLQEQLEVSLASYLEPTLQENITEDLNRDWFELLAASRAQFREDINQQINEIAVETLDASTSKTNELLFTLIRQLDETLGQMEQQRQLELAALQGNLELFVVQASDEILRTQGMVQQLALIKDDKIKPPQREIDKSNPINN